MEAGDDKATAAIAAGYTRLRPVLMTAGAMILGMIPMALGVGEGGEQNAPLARAVIGGLLFATFATLDVCSGHVSHVCGASEDHVCYWRAYNLTTMSPEAQRLL